MKENKDVGTAKVAETKREKTVSLTAKQISEISENPKLGQLLIKLINESEGNLKGKMAFAIAKAMTKQLNIEL